MIIIIINENHKLQNALNSLKHKVFLVYKEAQ